MKVIRVGIVWCVGMGLTVTPVLTDMPCQSVTFVFITLIMQMSKTPDKNLPHQ